MAGRRKSPARTAVQQTWPLKGARIVDLTQNVAGPYAAMVLAELGATVTKVEPPNGDATRVWGPPFWEGRSPTFLAINRNKKCIPIDLKTTAGQKALSGLLKRADAVLVSSRPGAMKRMGLDFGSIARRYPGIIYGEITSFGDSGPRALEPGYDPLIQALTGIMAVNVRPGEPPARVGVSIIDMAAGLWLALGILSAFALRINSQIGQRVSVSLYETGIAWMAYHAGSYWASGESPHGWGSGVAMVAPYEAFKTVDGWIVIAAGNDGLFQKLSNAFGHPEWVTDSRFRTNADRVKNRADLSSLIGNVTRGKKTNSLETLLKEIGVPASPVKSVAEALNEPQLLASGIVQTVPRPPISGFKSVGIPLKLNGRRPPLRSVPF